MGHSTGPTADELLRLARQGDAASRDRLFELCRGYLAVLARARVESSLRAKVDASDLVQQTMLEAHRDFDRFQGESEGEWLAWLRRILTHNAADFIRRYRQTAKRRARREVPLRHGDDSTAAYRAAEPAGREPSPSQQIVAAEDQLRLAAALAQLPPDYQEVIMLRNLQRLPFNEVAQRMERSRPAVQMLWMRAIRKLQAIVEAPVDPRPTPHQP